MREIKFRAWDPAGKKLYQHASISSDGKVDFCWNGTNQRLGLESYPGRTSDGVRYDEMIALQFTGLLDRNGKEIYEGDVVRGFDENEFGSVKDTPVHAKVIWWENSAGFQLEAIGPSEILHSDMAVNVEVIGDIYSNPELLNL